MNGDVLFEGIVINSRSINPFDNESRNYENIPVLSTLEELTDKEAKSKCEIYKAPSELFSDFLLQRFGYSLPDFMKLYSEMHFTALGYKEPCGFALPVPANTICYFAEATDPISLSTNLAEYQSSIGKDHAGRSFLNLHNDTIYKFTIIRAKFNLEAEKRQFYFGYHHTTDKFRFFIKSSIQFDLTVVYEEL